MSESKQEKRRRYAREYYLRNREKCKERSREYQRKRRERGESTGGKRVVKLGKPRYRRSNFEMQMAEAKARGEYTGINQSTTPARRAAARIQPAEVPAADEVVPRPEGIPDDLSRIDISKLTREQLITTIRVLRAWRNTQNTRLVERIVLQSHQVPIIKSKKKQVTISGGNQSGKTFMACFIVACYISRVKHFLYEDSEGRVFRAPFHRIPAHPLHLRYCTVDFELVETIILPYLREMIDHRKLKEGNFDRALRRKQGDPHRLMLADGGWLEFKTYKQDVQAYQAGQLDVTVEDEPNPDRDKHTENWMRTTKRSGRCYNVFTVWGKHGAITWERELYDKAQDPATEEWYDFFELSLLDNRFVTEESKRDICAGLTPDEYRARILGKAIMMSDKVYHRYNPDINIIADFTLQPHWPRVIIIDPHPDKAHAVDWFALDERDDIFWYRAIKRRATVPELVTHIRVLTGDEPVALWLIDPSSNQKSDNRGISSFKFQFIDAGLVQLVDGEVRNAEANIVRVNELLTPDSVTGKSRLRIFESLRSDPNDKDNWGPINEIENYVYVSSRVAEQVRDTKKPRDKWNDHCVNLRMLAAANPLFRNLIPLRMDTRRHREAARKPIYEQIGREDDEYQSVQWSRPQIVDSAGVFDDYD